MSSTQDEGVGTPPEQEVSRGSEHDKDQQDTLMLRKNRKAEHINLAVQYNEQFHPDAWHDIRFVHHSLPELAIGEIELSTQVAGRTWPVPLYINAMTGGIKEAAVVNRNLAEVASQHSLAIAVGSQSAALSDEGVVDTYRVVREANPRGIVLANVSASVHVADAMRAIEMLQADYLQLHLNVPQEIVMPEGDRDFRGMLDNIHRIVHASPVPVIVKEVGFGMSMEVYEQLLVAGVRIADVSGRGGTNFAWIEGQRREQTNQLFEDWGQTTAISLLEAQGFLQRMDFMASGGIRSALHIAKALALGARAVGVAGPLLKTFYRGGQDAVAAQVVDYIQGLQSIMLALGARTTEDLRSMPLIVTGDSRDWTEARGVDVKCLATRVRHSHEV